jgi:biotin carboxylase
MPENIKAFWIIGGGILQKPILDEVKLLGYKVIVSDMSETCYLANQADYFFEIDIFDEEGHLSKLIELKSKKISVCGVLAAGIDAPVTMARMNEKLNLYGVSSDICELVNHKANFRLWMADNNFEVPEFKEFQSDQFVKALEYIENIKAPFIIKNVNSSASRGTRIFFDINKIKDLEDTFNEACRVSRSNTCLIESIWEGSEHTVETFFDINGNFYPLFITDRIFDKTNGIPLEIGLENPTGLSAKEKKSCFKLAELISSTLGITVGAAKFDMIYTKAGPRIIEMTTRLSGGFDCQYLVPAATGKNIIASAVYTALGKNIPSSFLNTTKSRVALSGSIWPKSGKVLSINGLDEAKKINGVEHIFLRCKVGDHINEYENCASRVIFIIVSGKNRSEANKALRMAQEKIKIEV